MKKIIIALIPILLLSCKKNGVRTVGTENPNFSVTLLFTVDSCRVYRFIDNGYCRYFVTCQGQTMSGHRTGGKSNSYHPEEIQTTQIPQTVSDNNGVLIMNIGNKQYQFNSDTIISQKRIK